MAIFRLVALLLAFSALGASCAPVALADEAAEIFDSAKMYVIKLTLPPASEAALAEDPFDYQPGTFSIAETDGTPGGVGPFSPPVGVGVRLKGNYSFRPLGEKSAFKIKFNGSERLRGLRILTLNNMVSDPSMIHETLAYTAFRDAGVPASRTGYAYVYVNGEDFGIHLQIETLDEIALAKLFGSFDEDVQHLYEGENAADVRVGGAGGYEIDEGSDDRGDLEALIAAVNSDGPPDWVTRVSPFADLREMTLMWATEKYVGQWDGYAGQPEEWTPNNYYLFSDSNGRFQMMPWGNDETWQMEHRPAFDGPAGLMFNRCLADQACAAIYRQSVVAVRDAIAVADLDGLATSTASLLAPWQAMEEAASTREEFDGDEIAAGVAEVREFIATRPGEVAEWLGEAPPDDGVSSSGNGDRAADPGALDSLLKPHLQIHLPQRDFKVGRVWASGGILRAQVEARRPGVFVQKVTLQTEDGAVTACRTRAQVKRPQRLTLRCRLPDSAGEQLRQGHKDISVTIRFTPVGGKSQSVIRRIT